MKQPDSPKSANLGKPANDQIVDVNNTINSQYKKVFCVCSLCGLVGPEYIIQQYNNFYNILIEDRNSRLIFDPFLEKEVK